MCHPSPHVGMTSPGYETYEDELKILFLIVIIESGYLNHGLKNGHEWS